ncbi:conjugal transfer protein [Phenylobacterium zucineum HLK1]|uniref:Conjugal transfer protein n=1 Tax=Phenylobacterium zucineum (strain HLK1) TaxID=450851 RepID=B4RFU4_PHEZH|nr:lytic transglycosylase domain-containing protein [Phenylobacterium zucineum]ACG78757.1 conjugal transfer protein [Phenylobacterium zucineum HLK1]
MPLDLATLLPLASQCAPAVAPSTLLAIAKAESAFDPLAIGVNGAGGGALRPRSAEEAAAVARRLIANGRSIDLGLGQINSRNLSRLGLTVEAAFDPCRNLAASATVLSEGFDRATKVAPGEQAALRMALSIYNTGHPERGLRNGYVTRVTRAAASLVPALRTHAAANVSPPSASPPAAAPTWDVFARARIRSGGFVLTPSSGDLR